MLILLAMFQEQTSGHRGKGERPACLRRSRCPSGQVSAMGECETGVLTMAVDAAYVYASCESEVLAWCDKLALTGGGFLTVGYDVMSMTANGCAVFMISASVIGYPTIIPGILMFRPNCGVAPLPILNTSGNRLVYDSGCMYWSAGTGAIGKLAAPQ